jgi:hypothetical protein
LRTDAERATPQVCGPILGVTALESVGITVDPASRTLERLPAVPLKSITSWP